MTVKEAANNIDMVLANSRLTRQEHVILADSVKLLFDKASETEEQEKPCQILKKEPPKGK